ncbi:MAG: nucleoside-triphosphatase [Clostridiales bacterium]|nr:nucleoside-triphosphatase [Clostridiales bacterium]
MMQKILITGEMGVGKSTLVRDLLSRAHLEINGFFTIKRGSEVFLYDANDLLKGRAIPQCIGKCDENGIMTAYPSVFDTFGKTINRFPARSLIVMDELGFMERDAKVFCDAVLEIMASDRPVLAVVKARSAPFLDAVRANDNAMLFHITEANRTMRIAELDELMKALAW